MPTPDPPTPTSNDLSQYTETNPPNLVAKRAIDVTPHEHGIWCSSAGGPPFVNEIALRKWTDDGTRISVMLDSHNFDSWEPDEMVKVVELGPPRFPELHAKWMRKDAERMAKRPVVSESEPALVLALKALPDDAKSRIRSQLGW